MPLGGIRREAIEEREELSRCPTGALSWVCLQDTQGTPSRPKIEHRFRAPVLWCRRCATHTSMREAQSMSPRRKERPSCPSRSRLSEVPSCMFMTSSTVVIWSNPIGSYQDHGLLLGKYLCKDTVNRGALGQLVMDEHQEPLKQRTPLLPTGVPNGLDEAPCSIRYGRQTGQVQQRVGHEDQTPMFSDGFGSSHTILVEAQVPLTVLIKRFRRPALRIQADDLRGVPVHTVGHQHDMPSCQRLALKTDHDPDLAQGGDTNPQREAPIGVLAYCDGAIGIGRDQRHERLDRHVRAWQLQRPAIGI